MNLAGAQNAFMNLLNSVTEDDRVLLLSWIQRQWCNNDAEVEKSQTYQDLRAVADDIRGRVSESAIFPSEKIIVPESFLLKRKNNGFHNYIEKLDDAPTVHVDAFLYEDEDIDKLVVEGKMSRNICKKCRSTEVVPLNFISHSSSIPRIQFIFRYLLPDLSGAVFLDVGSRLGAMLYGAYYCSSAPKIIGVEMNEDLYNLQQYIIEKYNMKNRLKVVCSDVRQVPDLVSQANVIVLNNVFQYFVPKEEQTKLWIFLRNCINQKGTTLVTVPSIEESIQHLKTGIDVSTWLRKIRITDPCALLEMEEQDEVQEICHYVVV